MNPLNRVEPTMNSIATHAVSTGAAALKALSFWFDNMNDVTGVSQ
jgi:hypothetical protein